MTRHADCVDLLKWALPRLGLAWSGFRQVHHLVRKRIGRRLRDLHLGGFADYRLYLDTHPGEWERLAEMCRIPISRFLRDRAVFDGLAGEVLPSLIAAAAARRAARLRCWSAGCAGGEEPYSLALLWQFAPIARDPAILLEIVATDIDEQQISRARAGIYRASSLREVPRQWTDAAFERVGPLYRIRDGLRDGIVFERQDLAETAPPGVFDLILCRNLAFTYFAPERQRALMPRLAAALVRGGGLVIGRHETLPDEAAGFSTWFPELGIYRHSGAGLL